MNDWNQTISNAQAATIKLGSSTGVMISDRFAITAAHVPLDANNNMESGLTAMNIWNERINVKSVQSKVSSDFAIVELERPFSVSYAAKIASREAYANEDVFIVGFPKTVQQGGLGWAVATGKAYGKSIDGGILSAFDLDVYSGFSGSPIFNSNGEVVGVLSGSNSADFVNGGNLRTPWYQQNNQIANNVGDTLNGLSAMGVSHSEITSFMASKGVANVAGGNSSLPANRQDAPLDTFVDSGTLSQIASLDDASRMSSVVIGNGTFTQEGAMNRGSGTLITKNLILTNRHVVQGIEDQIVVGYAGGEKIHGTVKAISNKVDLALVEVSSSYNYNPVQFANDGITVNEKAYIVGSPGDSWYVEGGWKVTAATGEGIDGNNNSLKTSIRPGNSGGGVFDMSGKFAGVMWGTGISSENYSWIDRQDAHSTPWAPVAQPMASHGLSVDFKDVVEFVTPYMNSAPTPTQPTVPVTPTVPTTPTVPAPVTPVPVVPKPQVPVNSPNGPKLDAKDIVNFAPKFGTGIKMDIASMFTASDKVVISNLPSWVDYDAANKTVVSPITTRKNDVTKFQATVSDGNGNATTTNFVVNVNSSAISYEGSDMNDVVIAGDTTGLVTTGLGDDFINAGAGMDIIFTGEGNDTVYVGSSGMKNLDIIFDFTRGQDKIALSGDLVSKVKSGINAGNFVLGDAKDADDYLVFKDSTLYYDADGNGDGKAVELAMFFGVTVIGVSDITIV